MYQKRLCGTWCLPYFGTEKAAVFHLKKVKLLLHKEEGLNGLL